MNEVNMTVTDEQRETIPNMNLALHTAHVYFDMDTGRYEMRLCPVIAFVLRSYYLNDESGMGADMVYDPPLPVTLPEGVAKRGDNPVYFDAQSQKWHDPETAEGEGYDDLKAYLLKNEETRKEIMESWTD